MSTGTTVQVIGAVVDVEFPAGQIPKVYDALVIDDAEVIIDPNPPSARALPGFINIPTPASAPATAIVDTSRFVPSFIFRAVMDFSIPFMLLCRLVWPLTPSLVADCSSKSVVSLIDSTEVRPDDPSGDDVCAILIIVVAFVGDIGISPEDDSSVEMVADDLIGVEPVVNVCVTPNGPFWTPVLGLSSDQSKDSIVNTTEHIKDSRDVS